MQLNISGKHHNIYGMQRHFIGTQRFYIDTHRKKTGTQSLFSQCHYLSNMIARFFWQNQHIKTQSRLIKLYIG